MKSPVSGYFSISKNSIVILLHNRATALQIATYLVLARFKHYRYGEYTSNAGIDAVVNRLGIGRDKATREVDSLQGMEYKGCFLLGKYQMPLPVLDDDLSGEKAVITMNVLPSKFPPKKTSRVQEVSPNTKRWQLNSSGGSVQILNCLVGNGRHKVKPLHDLWYPRGNTAARLLLLALFHADTAFGVVSLETLTNIFDSEPQCTTGGYTIYTSKTSKTTKSPSNLITRLIYDMKSYDARETTRMLQDDLSSLEQKGFLKRVIVARVTGKDGNTAATYFLDMKDKTKGGVEKYYCREMASIAQICGLLPQRADNRHYESYYAIAPEDHNLEVSSGYRVPYLRLGGLAGGTASKDNKMVASWIASIMSFAMRPEMHGDGKSL